MQTEGNLEQKLELCGLPGTEWLRPCFFVFFFKQKLIISKLHLSVPLLIITFAV